MRKSNLTPVVGTEIDVPNWNLESKQVLLSYGGLNLIYAAEITPNQLAIIHWADIENDGDIEPGKEYTRALVIPMEQSTILQIANGTISMRETYLKHEIFVIDGLDEFSDGINFIWANCDKDFLEEYLPVPNHKLSDE